MDWFKWKGWPIRRNPNTGIYDPVRKIMRTTHQKGMPDLSAIIPRCFRIWEVNTPATTVWNQITIGHAVDIEVKIKPNKPTIEQLEWLKETNAAGGIGILAYSLDDVIKRLRREGIEV